LYSEFTNREIANIHGISKDFKLDSRKSTSRQVVGQGVTDIFREVAERIASSRENMYSLKMSNGIRSVVYESEVLDVAKKIASVKNIPFKATTVNESFDFILNLDDNNSFYKIT